VQVEKDSLLLGRLIHHSAFALADNIVQPIRRGGGESAGFNVQRPTDGHEAFRGGCRLEALVLVVGLRLKGKL
jgi:hypothetical protein